MNTIYPGRPFDSRQGMMVRPLQDHRGSWAPHHIPPIGFHQNASIPFGPYHGPNTALGFQMYGRPPNPQQYGQLNSPYPQTSYPPSQQRNPYGQPQRMIPGPITSPYPVHSMFANQVELQDVRRPTTSTPRAAVKAVHISEHLNHYRYNAPNQLPLSQTDNSKNDYGSMIRSQSRESFIASRTYKKYPNDWGSSRGATPIEVRGVLTTLERYHLNRSKSNLGSEFHPYSHQDYLNQKNRDQNMRLPRGLGPSEDERWKSEVSHY
jgi:hypothetical protein